MLFVSMATVRGDTGTSKERIARRLQWQYPEGSRVLGEYWLQTPDPAVIMIFEADDIAPIMAGNAEWDDYFSITVVPAISAKDGLELAKQTM